MGQRSPAPLLPCRSAVARGVLLALAVLLAVLVPGTASAQDASPSPPRPSARPSDPTAAQERIRGTLTDVQRNPVRGVAIVVEQGTTPVGRAVSDESGRFLVPVPGPGTYTVRIDRATLPPGLEPQLDRRDVRVRSGATAPALFSFGQQERRATSRFEQAPQLLVGGLQFGLVIAMAAVGLSLIFGTTGLTNFAHGELITGGALLGYVFNVGLGLNLVPATVIAVLVGGLVGGLLDRLLWRPLRRRGTGLIAALVVSIGLSLVLRYVYLYFYGGGSRSYLQYATQDPLQLGPVTVLPRDLVILAVSLVALVGVALALQRTRLGKATRAVSDNPSLAASSGIDVERVINVVWVVGTALAVLGGVFLALSQQVGYQLGQNILLLLFAGVTLGGLGTAYGALVGSLVVGVFTQLSTLFIPAELQVVGALVVLILILIVRPQGILGRAERVG
ncbi:MAG: branched-chain amino acid ABC transporter permease [Actinomycetota bacterium]|nr:branched-chain amino acid ABC transporter permease [Actinomycetota bacterium]